MKKYKVKYESTVDFLQWEITIKASSEEEVREIIKKFGKVLCIEEVCSD